LLKEFSIVFGEEEELAGVLGVFVNFSMVAGGAGGESVFVDLEVVLKLPMVMVMVVGM
jgi:hypothetical protein